MDLSRKYWISLTVNISIIHLVVQLLFFSHKAWINIILNTQVLKYVSSLPHNLNHFENDARTLLREFERMTDNTENTNHQVQEQDQDFQSETDLLS